MMNAFQFTFFIVRPFFPPPSASFKDISTTLYHRRLFQATILLLFYISTRGCKRFYYSKSRAPWHNVFVIFGIISPISIISVSYNYGNKILPIHLFYSYYALFLRMDFFLLLLFFSSLGYFYVMGISDFLLSVFFSCLFSLCIFFSVVYLEREQRFSW